MNIYRNGSMAAVRGAAETFTGTVWQQVIIAAPEPGRVRSGYARFEPGSRTAWHTHPLGQTLCVLSGLGRVQKWGEMIREIRAGDVVWIPPGEKHWHGAAPTSTLVYIATAEALNGTHVNWLEHVSDQQYDATVDRD